jgi:putative FmdB family regulatory protein
MPIYTYRCENCGVQFERQQKFTDQPLTRCPECNKKTLHKVYTPVGIIFKGSGFYATDHRSPSGQGRYSSKDEGEGKGESAKSESTKVEGEKKSETKKTAASTDEK